MSAKSALTIFALTLKYMGRIRHVLEIWLRITAQIYNGIEYYEKLGKAVLARHPCDNVRGIGRLPRATLETRERFKKLCGFSTRLLLLTLFTSRDEGRNACREPADS
jgi:hypothetical protein